MLLAITCHAHHGRHPRICHRGWRRSPHPRSHQSPSLPSLPYFICTTRFLNLKIFNISLHCSPASIFRSMDSCRRYNSASVHCQQLLMPWHSSLCLGVHVSSIATAGVQAGNLSLINLIPLFLGPHLSFLADILGVSLSTFRRIHRSAGLMSLGLVLFHALVIVTSSTAFTLSNAKNLSAVVVSTQISLDLLVVH